MPRRAQRATEAFPPHRCRWRGALAEKSCVSYAVQRGAAASAFFVVFLICQHSLSTKRRSQQRSSINPPAGENTNVRHLLLFKTCVRASCERLFSRNEEHAADSGPQFFGKQEFLVYPSFGSHHYFLPCVVIEHTCRCGWKKQAAMGDGDIGAREHRN